ncbi:hypothetical protein AF72_13425 [Xylella taiwanensis]|uniref:Uncharacterized protein n=1 Tax=Xylella taiwanensis TaxID=1444770 RepID=Z9JGS5_9GAMM|nr:hypothetical protein AF72_13425 [Xylella taiwanensis]
MDIIRVRFVQGLNDDWAVIMVWDTQHDHLFLEVSVQSMYMM